MSNRVKYIIDKKGKLTNVVVPLKVWEKLNSKYQKLLKKLEILSGIQKELKSIKQIETSRKKILSFGGAFKDMKNQDFSDFQKRTKKLRK